VLCDSGVSVEVKVQAWASEQNMCSYLRVARGSFEPPIFLELAYYGTDHTTEPIVLIGQGITFNSGGVNLETNTSHPMDQRGSIAGAASVVAACRAIAALRLPVNIRGLIPLCEHMIGAEAARPGDVIRAKNGLSIEIEHTRSAAVLTLNDALTHAQSYNPKLIVDVGTISSDTSAAFGRACSAAFTPSDQLWERLQAAGVHTGDRMWRMPLWDFYRKQMKTSSRVDLRNVGIGRGGGACKAAAFLNEFVATDNWVHIDAFNVIRANGVDEKYLKRGMAGRPTRTLIEFIAKMCCDDAAKDSSKKVTKMIQSAAIKPLIRRGSRRIVGILRNLYKQLTKLLNTFIALIYKLCHGGKVYNFLKLLIIIIIILIFLY